MSSVHSTGTIKKAVSWNYLLYTFGWGTFKGVLLSCAFALLRCLWCCISVSFLYSLCWSFRTCLNFFTEARSWEMKRSYDIWLTPGTELYGRAENISDRFHLHIWYVHQQDIWPLESLFPQYFSAYWTARKTHPGGCPPVLVTYMWKIWNTQFKQYAFSVFANPSL